MLALVSVEKAVTTATKKDFWSQWLPEKSENGASDVPMHLYHNSRNELSMTVNPDQQDGPLPPPTLAPVPTGPGEVATMNFDTESALYATLGGGYASLGRPASAQRRQRNPEGTIRVAAGANLDRESTPRITVQAVATDQGIDQGQRKSASVPVHVELEDENDNTPEFSKSVYEVSISSTTPAHTPILQLSATDRDLGDNVLFKLLPNDMSGEFELDGKTGVLRMAAPPTRLDYELRAEARDGDGRGPHLALATVRVSVAGLNRHAPRFIVPSLPNATVWIPENQSVPEYLVTTVEAMDEDEGDDGKVTYSIKVGDKNVEQTEDFKINPKSGELWTRGVLDREVRPQYELVLAAKDAGNPVPFETLQALTVKLKDEDDNVPEFPRKHMTNPYKMIVEENLPQGTLVGKVEAIDRDIGDNAHVYYYILDSDGPGIFVIDKLTGEIRTDISLDREQRAQYHLVVKATSNPDYLVFFAYNYHRKIGEEWTSGIGLTLEINTTTTTTNLDVFSRKSHPLGVTVEERSYKAEDLSLALVEIQVGDQNDNEPVFLNTPYLAGVRASAPVGDTVLTVTVKDEDSGTNGSVTLRLESVSLLRRGATGPPIQPVPAPFTIEPSGQVVTTQLMTQFDQARFLIIVVAREDASPHRVVRATIKLWIYNPSQLVRLILTHPPEEVHSKKKNFTEDLVSCLEILRECSVILMHTDLPVSPTKLKSYGIRTIYKNSPNLLTSLRHPHTKSSAPPDPLRSVGAVYSVSCEQCPATYVGETGRSVSIRMTEHSRNISRQDTRLLSSATSGLAIIDDIRYHVKDKNIIYKKWTDLYIHVVDQNDKLVPIPHVLEAFDSNLQMLQQNKLNIHKVVLHVIWNDNIINLVQPAYAELVEDEFDFPLTILILLLVLLFIGLVTMVVCCLCMKNCDGPKSHPWASDVPMHLYHNSRNELSMTVNPDQQDGPLPPPTLAPVPTGPGEVATMNFDTESALYATLGGGYASLGRPASAQRRQRNPESPAYHELPPQETASMSTFAPPPPPPPQPGPSHSSLSLNQDGEPMLVTQLL
ncbi:hypothetical protein LAZ67_15001897 [Cordylochernes scorpioides]|uniref:Cadherin domain-containing protein n=1 Tax=Cordylochernes scorpioides TaxID=51811 RepID=A0ABY6L9E2_9ARAC|nr:hypothetical protein LAZ67_15001897 [Cordylochernes scorpioides]